MSKCMKSLLALTLAVLCLIALPFSLSSCANRKTPDGKELPSGYKTSDSPTDYVCMSISYTDKNNKSQTGLVIVKLESDAAPITVANFKNLVASKFYDGLTFHRVYKGFMIQGGDPDGDGSGGSATPIKGEFSSNGWDNPISHKRGVISMARTTPDSASSQFFIVHEDSTFLDGDYAAFGNVVYGMETVDGIASIKVSAVSVNGKPEWSKPVYTVKINSMCFVKPQ